MAKQESTVDILIHVSPNDSTAGDIQTLISNHGVALSLSQPVLMQQQTLWLQALVMRQTLPSWRDNTADSFGYYVLDEASNISNEAAVNFSIEATNDAITLCHYSLYEYAQNVAQ